MGSELSYMLYLFDFCIITPLFGLFQCCGSGSGLFADSITAVHHNYFFFGPKDTTLVLQQFSNMVGIRKAFVELKILHDIPVICLTVATYTVRSTTVSGQKMVQATAVLQNIAYCCALIQNYF
jgi:hypothetical protein